MNVHLTYLTIIFVLYVLAGDMIATYLWSTNELTKGGGSIRGHTLTPLKGSSYHARVVRIVWPLIALACMFSPRKKP